MTLNFKVKQKQDSQTRQQRNNREARREVRPLQTEQGHETKKSNSALKKNINKNKTLSNTTGLGNYDSNKKMSLFPKVMKMKD